MCSAASSRRPWWPRSAKASSSGAEQAALAASYGAEDWSVADTALLDELVAMLGPIEPDEAEEPLLFLGDGTQMTELVTTADRLRDVRESTRPTTPTTPSPTCWSTRPRTSARCSGGCCAVGVPRRAGRSSATRRRAAGRTWTRSARRRIALIGRPRTANSGCPPTTAARPRCSSWQPRWSAVPTRRPTCPRRPSDRRRAAAAGRTERRPGRRSGPAGGRAGRPASRAPSRVIAALSRVKGSRPGRGNGGRHRERAHRLRQPAERQGPRVRRGHRWSARTRSWRNPRWGARALTSR